MVPPLPPPRLPRPQVKEWNHSEGGEGVAGVLQCMKRPGDGRADFCPLQALSSPPAIVGATNSQLSVGVDYY